MEEDLRELREMIDSDIESVGGVEEDCTHEKMLKCTKQYFERKII